MNSFTVYRIWNDELTDKEHLDSWDEVKEWMLRKLYGQVRIVRDSDSKTRDAMLTTEPMMTSEGEVWVDVYDWVS